MPLASFETANFDASEGVEISIAHENRLSSLTHHLGDRLSEYCFSNIFAFRGKHRYRFHDGRFPYISGITYDATKIIMPLFALDTAPAALLQSIMQGYEAFYPISTEALARSPESLPAQVCNEEDSDYLYLTDALISLPGTVLKKKRQQIAQLLRSTPDVRVKLFQADDVTDAAKILSGWLSDVGRLIEDTDYNECHDALSNFIKLPMFGLLCLSGDRQPLGFVLASEVWPDTCSIHFAKGRRDPQGVTAFLFQKFAETVSGRYKFINFEQDLGKVNFRAAKRAYAPVRLLPKYRIGFERCSAGI